MGRNEMPVMEGEDMEPSNELQERIVTGLELLIGLLGAIHADTLFPGEIGKSIGLKRVSVKSYASDGRWLIDAARKENP